MQRKYKSGAQKRKEKQLRAEAAQANHGNQTLFSVAQCATSTTSSDISIVLDSFSSGGAELSTETSAIDLMTQQHLRVHSLWLINQLNQMKTIMKRCCLKMSNLCHQVQ